MSAAFMMIVAGESAGAKGATWTDAAAMALLGKDRVSTTEPSALSAANVVLPRVRPR
ncbi:hypothetical protein [Amycolatopsis sp. lyj-346]|uniref:hypothetical protein n=1 Tax=Amycolatopsis sp. lyj-346 TaxID=2789289 RepID=UPI00397D6160